MGTAVSVLAAIMVMAPGFACLFFFALLFTNKECRQIWVTCFRKVTRLFVFPFTRRPRSETEGARSRCSSTVTVLTERRLSADLAVRYNVVSFIATDGNPGKAHAPEPRTDGLVGLTMDQLQASRSEFSARIGGGSDGESREEGECDETTALRDVDLSMVTPAAGAKFISSRSSEECVTNTDVHSFADPESKEIGSLADATVRNSCENLTQL